MKKFLLVALTAAIFDVSFAQNEAQLTIKGSKHITEQLTPHQVIDTLKKRFPNAEAVQYYETSAATAKGWAVTTEDYSAPGSTTEYYTLSFKRHDFQYYALFQPDGTLVKSEFQQTDVELPEAVKASLKKLAADKNYTDYQIISKTYYKYENYDMHKDYYEITAINKNDNTKKKTVVVDPSGKIIKEK